MQENGGQDYLKIILIMYTSIYLIDNIYTNITKKFNSKFKLFMFFEN